MKKEIGFGGGCHWCTEAVFASLEGVLLVNQGWIASCTPHDAFSEAVQICYDDEVIALQDVIEIHLHTHASTSFHSMRRKYRSAVYVFDVEDGNKATQIMKALQPNFAQPIITQVLLFKSFTPSPPQFQNYYLSNPEKPFCTVYIHPKLKLLKERFAKHTK